MKSEKTMEEALKRVKECQNNDIWTQMNKIKKEFLCQRVVGDPQSAIQVLSIWFMMKSRKVTSVNTNMKDRCVSLPKTQWQLVQMDDDDDEDVFATSIIDRYPARPPILVNMCLATFAVNYNVAQGNDKLIEVEETNANELSETEEHDICTKITIIDGLGYMHKRNACQEIQTSKRATKMLSFKMNPILSLEEWRWLDHRIQFLYVSFNEDCERFNSALEAFENDVIPQSAWDSIVPSVTEENAVTNTQGFQTIQMTTEEKEYYCNKTWYKCTSRNRSTIKIICLNCMYTHDDLPRLLFKNAISE